MLQGLVVLALGLRLVPFVLEGDAEVQMGVCIAGVKLYGLAIFLLGLKKIPLLM